MTDRANELSAEYLIRKVPVDWQAHEDAADLAREQAEHVSPLRFAAGAVVLGLVFVLIFWGV